MSFPIQARVVWLVCYDWLRWRTSFKDLALQECVHTPSAVWTCTCARPTTQSHWPDCHYGSRCEHYLSVSQWKSAETELVVWFADPWMLHTHTYTHTDCLTLYTHISMWFHPHLCSMNVHSWWLADENVSVWSLKSCKCSKTTGRGAAKKQWIQLQLIHLHLIMCFK